MWYPMLVIISFAFALAIPPAAKVLAVSVAVYGVLQAVKLAPWFSSWLKGWFAVLFNVVFTIIGLVITIPADQLYTVNTLETLLVTVLASSGIHGTVTKVILPPATSDVTPPLPLPQPPNVIVQDQGQVQQKAIPQPPPPAVKAKL
jgi:hypothetical protein